MSIKNQTDQKTLLFFYTLLFMGLCLVVFTHCTRDSHSPTPSDSPKPLSKTEDRNKLPRHIQHKAGTFSHWGMCDASAGAFLDHHLFVAGNDEDNVLRIYEANRSSSSKAQLPLGSFLALEDTRHPETDIEGATRVDNLIYWITSHGRNRKGKKRPNRHRFFATRLVSINGKTRLKGEGIPYKHLFSDMINCPLLAKYHLESAARLAPKSPGALNIEGLTKTDTQTLLIGFRNPLVSSSKKDQCSFRSLLVPLLNPKEIIAGKRACFGAPIELDFTDLREGKNCLPLGIRSIEYWKQRKIYLIIAGSPGDKGPFYLLSWSGNPRSKPRPISEIDLKGLHPEAILIPQKGDRVVLLSDDGTQKISGRKCKRAPPSKRRFRSLWVAIPKVSSTGQKKPDTATTQKDPPSP